MKKMFLSLVALLFVSVLAFSASWDNTTQHPLYGNQTIVGLGKHPGNMSAIAAPYNTEVDVNIGDVMVFHSTTSTVKVPYGVSVTQTTTVGSQEFAGVVVFPTGTTSADAGDEVYLAWGGTCLIRSAVNVSKGDHLILSATAGKVTLTSATAGDTFLLTSRTATVAVALENKTFGAAAGGGLVRARLIP